MFKRFAKFVVLGIFSVFLVVAVANTGRLGAQTIGSPVVWKHLSSANGDLPVPNSGDQQTCCVVFDVDKDGINDFVIGERTERPAVVWFKNTGQGWKRFVIEPDKLRPEAGGTACDIDHDGDLDLVLGQDASGNEIWWWENPYPNCQKPWPRHYIKRSGKAKHHDQLAADVNGDGAVELVSWNQRAAALLLFEIPRNPVSRQEWDATVIFRWQSGPECEGFPYQPQDIDRDGLDDIVGAGMWFKFEQERFVPQIIDAQMRFTQCAVGDLVEGGWCEVVFSPGDMDGVAKWYQWSGKNWQAHRLDYVRHGHTCQVGDINGDGHLDILIGEMGSPGAGSDARILIWYGDGRGNFRKTVALQGQGIHEGILEDLDGDGDLDILVKPYHHNAPRVDVLINLGPASS